MVGEHRYRAYGSSRGGDELATDHRFTGQKVDGTGLYYYNARYYDPALGAFISPNTLVPDPTTLLDYNRYLYGLGNPVKFRDPSGHCSTLADGSRDTDGDGDCWQKVDAIINGYWYGDNEWWNDRFISSAHFMETLATMDTLDAEWMDLQIRDYLTRNGPVHYLNPQHQVHPVTAQDQLFERLMDKARCEEPSACITNTLNIVGTGGAGVAAACTIASGGICAVVAAPAGAVSIAAGGINLTYTAYRAMKDKSSDADLVTAATTFTIGAAREVGGESVKKINPWLGLTANIYQ